MSQRLEPFSQAQNFNRVTELFSPTQSLVRQLVPVDVDIGGGQGQMIGRNVAFTADRPAKMNDGQAPHAQFTVLASANKLRPMIFCSPVNPQLQATFLKSEIIPQI